MMMARNCRHRHPITVRGRRVDSAKGIASMVRMTGTKLNHGKCRNRNTLIQSRRLSTTEADAAGAVETPSSEETAQHLSQLLEQPLALESFITKELTVSQRQAIQRLLQTSEIEVDVPEPSTHSLRLVAFNTSIPFVGKQFELICCFSGCVTLISINYDAKLSESWTT